MKALGQQFDTTHQQVSDLPHHLYRHVADQATFLGQGNELVRADQFPRWALPAHQHFGADDPLTVAVHDGLEIGHKLRRPQPMRQLCVERSGSADAAVHRPSEQQREEQAGLQQVALVLHYLIPRGGGVHAGVNGIGVFLRVRGGNRGIGSKRGSRAIFAVGIEPGITDVQPALCTATGQLQHVLNG